MRDALAVAMDTEVQIDAMETPEGETFRGGGWSAAKRPPLEAELSGHPTVSLWQTDCFGACTSSCAIADR